MLNRVQVYLAGAGEALDCLPFPNYSMRYLSPLMGHLNAFLILLSLGTARAQPTKTLTGRLLSEELQGVPKATIYAQDTTVIGQTDLEGYFKLDVPVHTTKLIFASVGMKWNTVTLSAACSTLEVILLNAYTHDFMSVRRVNRQEFKQFKQLPQLHQQAYEKGLFTARTPCATPVFTKWVPRPAKR